MSVAEGEGILVGRVMKAHGIRGEVAVESLTDVAGRFEPGATLSCGDVTLTVASSRPHQGRMLVRFEEVPDRTGAEGLRGAALTIPAEQVAPLPDGSFYPHQLEGLAVVGVDGSALGSFRRVETSPAHDLWVVATPRGEVTVPAVKAIVVSVDLAAGRITLDPPQGLFP